MITVKTKSKQTKKNETKAGLGVIFKGIRTEQGYQELARAVFQGEKIHVQQAQGSTSSSDGP